jgi:outer membrane protein OmpA-like peptidoglycan-associated protein
MKNLLASVIAICSLLSSVYSQTKSPIRQSAIGISFSLTDFVTASRIRTGSLTQVINKKQLAKFREMSPGIGISYYKGLLSHIDFAATLNGTFLDYPFRNRAPFSNNNFLLEGDASANFKLMTEDYWLIPYASAGIGAHMYKVYYGAFIPIGIGVRINLFDEAGININSQYRIPVNYETSNYHFYHSFGVYGIIGKKKEEVKPLPQVPVAEPPKDTDGDGITDDIDKCPSVPGVAKYDGCPVPDSDKDGINDENDKCPTVPGLARYQGCPVPDTDKDGINDEEDKCPAVAGVARYQGCPVPDTDGDGVNDEEDKCPTIAGLPENQGCPAIKEEVKKKVDFAAQNILFATGSYKLLSGSNKGLNEVVKILQGNPDLKLSIDGHTDNTGTPEKNLALSQSRANSVKDYLVSKGIDASRLTATGHGQDEPIADNKTAAGRQKNRRVEMKLSY